MQGTLDRCTTKIMIETILDFLNSQRDASCIIDKTCRKPCIFPSGQIIFTPCKAGSGHSLPHCWQGWMPRCGTRSFRFAWRRPAASVNPGSREQFGATHFNGQQIFDGCKKINFSSLCIFLTWLTASSSGKNRSYEWKQDILWGHSICW